MYSSNWKQWKNFDEVYCCVCKNIEKIEMFVKDFFSLDVMDLCLLPCFCILFKKTIEKCYKGIYVRSSSDTL